MDGIKKGEREKKKKMERTSAAKEGRERKKPGAESDLGSSALGKGLSVASSPRRGRGIRRRLEREVGFARRGRAAENLEPWP